MTPSFPEKNTSIYFGVFRRLNSWNCVLKFLNAYIYRTIFHKEQDCNTRTVKEWSMKQSILATECFQEKKIIYFLVV